MYIEDIIARQIIDSRGNPTIEVDVRLDDGTLGFGQSQILAGSDYPFAIMDADPALRLASLEIGRASCRERVLWYV